MRCVAGNLPKITESGNQKSTEFRQEAVRVALTSELTQKQEAADFGIHCQAGHVYMPEMGVSTLIR